MSKSATRRPGREEDPGVPVDRSDLLDVLGRHGFSRRDFLKFCGSVAILLGLPSTGVAEIADALSKGKKPVLVWLEFQDCAGNTESALRASHPTVAELVLNTFSWEYHETIMAAAGTQAEDNLRNIVKNEKGRYVAVVEGSIPLKDGGVYCTIAGRTALEIAREVCSGAAAVVAVGACAWDGGLVRSDPNPTGALGIGQAMPELNVVNMGGCPHNVVNLTAVLVHYLTYHRMPALDSYNRPLFAHASLIHDQCERRAHYDAGQYVEAWGDEGHRRGWCLYRMGCKGPIATYNCPNARWNEQTSWPVKAGHNCLACASYRFWDVASPFYERLPHMPGFGADVTAGEVGLWLAGAVAAGTAVHAVAGAVRSKLRHEEPPVETTTSGQKPQGGEHGKDRS
jgi:hydrogenase small subunit